MAAHIRCIIIRIDILGISGNESMSCENLRFVLRHFLLTFRNLEGRYWDQTRGVTELFSSSASSHCQHQKQIKAKKKRCEDKIPGMSHDAVCPQGLIILYTEAEIENLGAKIMKNLVGGLTLVFNFKLICCCNKCW